MVPVILLGLGAIGLVLCLIFLTFGCVMSACLALFRRSMFERWGMQPPPLLKEGEALQALAADRPALRGEIRAYQRQLLAAARDAKRFFWASFASFIFCALLISAGLIVLFA